MVDSEPQRCSEVEAETQLTLLPLTQPSVLVSRSVGTKTSRPDTSHEERPAWSGRCVLQGFMPRDYRQYMLPIRSTTEDLGH